MTEVGETTVRALSCPACGGPVDLRTPGSTVNLFCVHCGAGLDALSEELKLIATAEGIAAQPRIPLGARGILRGVLWEVVGYIERYEHGGGRWEEHLLFNPYYGYRFLVDDRRSWSLGRQLDTPPVRIAPGQYWLGDVHLRSFGFAYTARVRSVVGEFYWRLSRDDEARLTDYVAPGIMVSMEELEDEVTWTRLDILQPGEVEAAFSINRRRRSDTPSPHEIAPWVSLLRPIWACAGLAFVLLILLSVLAPRQANVAATGFTPLYDQPERTYVLHDLQLPYSGNRLVIQADAPELNNGWIDMDISLVDQRTQQSFDGYLLPEYYSGWDSDGSWHEGDSKPSMVFSHVPKGRYDLVIDASAHSWDPSVTTSSYDWQSPKTTPDPALAALPPTGPEVSTTVMSGGVSGDNWLLALLAILAPPLALWGLNHQFEVRRRGALQ